MVAPAGEGGRVKPCRNGRGPVWGEGDGVTLRVAPTAAVAARYPRSGVTGMRDMLCQGIISSIYSQPPDRNPSPHVMPAFPPRHLNRLSVPTVPAVPPVPAVPNPLPRKMEHPVAARAGQDSNAFSPAPNPAAPRGGWPVQARPGRAGAVMTELLPAIMPSPPSARRAVTSPAVGFVPRFRPRGPGCERSFP